MEPIRRIALILVAALTLGLMATLPAAAQLQEAEALDKRVLELSQAEKYAEAIPLAQRALTIREKTLGPQHLEVGQSLLALGDLCLKLNRYAEAETYFKRSLAIYEKTLSANNPNLQKSLVKLAQVSRSLGRQAEAEQYTKRAEALNSGPRVAGASPQIAATVPPAARDVPLTTRSVRPPPAGAPPSSAAASPAPPAAEGASPTARGGALPDFPWPPPTASASYNLPRNLLPAPGTVGQVAEKIVAALESTGYVERSFFRTQADGVALVTRLESINDDGTALAAGKRWPTLQDSKDLMSAMRGLFFVERGHYRVIVFILQDQPFVQSSTNTVSGPQARAWLQTGANMLPRDVASRSFEQGQCSVLIYEFASDGTAVRQVDSRLTGKEHLEKAGVLANLARAN